MVGNIVRLRVKNFYDLNRQCSLVLDQISLKTQQTYNQYFDRIGLTENGYVSACALLFIDALIVNGNKPLLLHSCIIL